MIEVFRPADAVVLNAECQGSPSLTASGLVAFVRSIQKRLHSAIGYVSPAEFEAAFTVRKAAWSNCPPNWRRPQPVDATLRER